MLAGMMHRRGFRRTTIMMWGLGALLIGLACGRRWPGASWLYLMPAGLGLAVARRARGVFIASILLGFTVGWWRGGQFRHQLLPYERLYGQQVSVLVTAKTDGSYAESGNLGFDVGEVYFNAPEQRRLPGQLKIETRGLPAVFRGDRLEVQGKLYPAGGSKQGSIKYAAGRLVHRSVSPLETLRLEFVAAMQSALPEPAASLGLGILIGQRSTLPKDTTKQLAAVGLTHIVAVSGYNLTIIVRFLGKKLGRSKYQTLVLSISLIVSFILITGFSASIVRAGLVSLLSLGAWYYGRAFRPLLIILLTAALTACWNPVYLWSDIGWYLSFLAFFGVLILAPLLTRYFWRERSPSGLMPLVIESGCAQIMTAPLIAHIFGETSLIALPANMVIVPLVPLAMLLSLIAGLTGMVWSQLAAWLAWPARVLLEYMLEMCDLLSRVPHALLGLAVPLWGMLLAYGLLVSVCAWLWWKTRAKFATLTDENYVRS